MKVGDVISDEMIDFLGRSLQTWTGIMVTWHPWQGRVVIRKGANGIWRVTEIERPDP